MAPDTDSFLSCLPFILLIFNFIFKRGELCMIIISHTAQLEGSQFPDPGLNPGRGSESLESVTSPQGNSPFYFEGKLGSERLCYLPEVTQPGSVGSRGQTCALSRGESKSEVAQSCPTLCDPMDCSPPGSSIHGILQVRILEWVAISFSRGPSRPRD